MDRGLAVHLGDQRTGRIERRRNCGLGLGRDRFGHPVGRKYHRRVGFGDFRQFLDENRALGLQAVDDVSVVDDLVADIDRGAIEERPLHGIDGPDDPGTEAAGRTKHDSEGGLADMGPISDRISPCRQAWNERSIQIRTCRIRTWDRFWALSRLF